MDNPDQQSPNESATEQSHGSSKPSFHSKIILVTIILFILVLVSLLTLLLGLRSKTAYRPPTNIFSVPSRVQSTSVPTTDPMAGWKTYTSTASAYLIQFPSNFEITEQVAKQTKEKQFENTRCIKETNSSFDGCNVSVAVYYAENLTLDKWLTKYPRFILTYGDKMIQETPAKKMFNTYDAREIRDETSVTYYLFNNNRIYELHSSINKDDIKILSTFRFE